MIPSFILNCSVNLVNLRIKFGLDCRGNADSLVGKPYKNSEPNVLSGRIDSIIGKSVHIIPLANSGNHNICLITIQVNW
jgi:hypothetical protein